MRENIDMDSRAPNTSGSYFFTKSRSSTVDINQRGQEPGTGNGLYRSNSNPPNQTNDNDYEHEAKETQFYSENEKKFLNPHPRHYSETGNNVSEKCQKNSIEHPESLDNPGERGEWKPKLKFSQILARSKFTLIMLAFAQFWAGCGFSLLAPFYPREAADKGVSQTIIGFVFSIFELVDFLASPVFGNYLTILGAKFVYTSGILVAGCTAILFGFLDQGPPGTTFIVLSFLVRSIEALGVAAFSTAGFAIISNEFPNHIASVFAILETCLGIGLMVGPAIGGALYEVGGFGLPFWVVGAAIVANGLAVCAWLPVPTDTTVKLQGTVFTLLKSSMVWVTILCIMVGSLGVGYLEPILANHLEQFGLSTVVVGLFFMISPCLYAITAPLWGYVTDRKGAHSLLLVGGLFGCAISFAFIGPSPLFPFLPRELWTVTVGLILYGSLMGGNFVPTMTCLTIGASDIGLSDNLNTFALVSGLFNSIFCLGAFIGPTIGGALVDRIGFYHASSIIAGLHFVTMVIVAIYFYLRRLRKKTSSKSCTVLDQDKEDEMPDNEKLPLTLTTASKVGGVDNPSSATYSQLQRSLEKCATSIDK